MMPPYRPQRSSNARQLMREAFFAQGDTRRSLAQLLVSAGFSIESWGNTGEGPSWYLLAKPVPRLKQTLRIFREVLIWVVEFHEFQARTVSKAQEYLVSHRPRLSEELAIVLTNAPDTTRCVRETAESLDTTFVGFPLSIIPHHRPAGLQDFVLTLQSQLFVRDLYLVSTALRTSTAFFGRKNLLRDLKEKLKSGGAHIGLFGLRKMGKTSLLYQVLTALLKSDRTFVAHVDLQRVDAINPTGEYLLWSLGQALFDTNQLARGTPGLRLFGKYDIFGDIPDRSQVFDLFNHDITHLLSLHNHSIVLLFDEIEIMFSDGPQSDWKAAFVRVWRLLRGLAQEYPSRLSYFVTGTNPRCVEVSKVGNQDNPIFNFFEKKFLPPLTSSETKELLNQLGQRMGIEWHESAIQRLVARVGGHPFLVRAYASLIHRAYLPRTKQMQVSQGMVDDNFARFMTEFSSSLSQMVEVLAEQYSDEYFILETLAQGRYGEFRDLVRAFPEETSHLIGYGLISDTCENTGLAVEALQSWLQRKTTIKRHAATPGFLPPGTLIDRYEIISSLGQPGGFARVYKARLHGTDDLFAVKVFENGSISSVQRECDALEGIRHPNIVGIHHYGVTTDGVVFLVMEHLDGRVLREVCDRGTRLDAAETETVLRGLLLALVKLHPNQEKLDELRRKEFMEPDELDELELARHGYIHRDIKPENVILVPDRGPVLIDFNISSRVDSSVKTRSMTPGYIPPDGLADRWSPDVDLYQAGLTVLQAALGYRYQDNREDLRLLAEKELPSPVREVLIKMTAGRQDERFATARAALASLGECPVE